MHQVQVLLPEGEWNALWIVGKTSRSKRLTDVANDLKENRIRSKGSADRLSLDYPHTTSGGAAYVCGTATF